MASVHLRWALYFQHREGETQQLAHLGTVVEGSQLECESKQVRDTVSVSLSKQTRREATVSLPISATALKHKEKKPKSVC